MRPKNAASIHMLPPSGTRGIMVFAGLAFIGGGVLALSKHAEAEQADRFMLVFSIFFLVFGPFILLSAILLHGPRRVDVQGGRVRISTTLRPRKTFLDESIVEYQDVVVRNMYEGQKARPMWTVYAVVNGNESEIWQSLSKEDAERVGADLRAFIEAQRR